MLRSPSTSVEVVDVAGKDGEGSSSTKVESDPPISLYNTVWKDGMHRAIAVNRKYIAYYVRAKSGAAVRVINLETHNKTLLKGHSGVLVDIQFAATDVDVVATVDSDGLFIVWVLTEQGETITPYKLIQVSAEGPGPYRVVWNILSRGQELAMFSSGTVKVWQIGPVFQHAGQDTFIHEGQETHPISNFSAHLPEGRLGGGIFSVADGLGGENNGNEGVNDVSFSCGSPSGDQFVATAHSNGVVRVYKLDKSGATAGFGSYSCVKVIQLPGGGSADSVVFCYARGNGTGNGKMVLLTGSNDNTQFDLWDADSYAKIQSLALAPSAGAAPLGLRVHSDPNFNFVTLSALSTGLLFVLRLDASEGGDAQFTSLTTLPLLMPLLSMVVNSSSSEEAGDGDGSSQHELEIFGLSAKKIEKLSAKFTTAETQYFESGNAAGGAEAEAGAKELLPSLSGFTEQAAAAEEEEEEEEEDTTAAEAAMAAAALAASEAAAAAEETRAAEAAAAAEAEADAASAKAAQEQVAAAAAAKAADEKAAASAAAAAAQAAQAAAEAEAEAAAAAVAAAAAEAEAAAAAVAAAAAEAEAVAEATAAAAAAATATAAAAAATPVPTAARGGDGPGSAAVMAQLAMQTNALKQMMMASAAQTDSLKKMFAQQNVQATKITQLQALVEKQHKHIVQIKTDVLRSEVGVANKVETMFKKQLAEHSRELAAIRQQAAKTEAEKVKRLLKAITDTLSTSIGSKVSAAVAAETAKSVVPAITAALNDKVVGGKVTQALSMGFNAMNTSVRSYIPKLITSADVTQGLAKAVASAVAAPVTAAASAAFRNTVVPAVEGGCQEMFRQVDAQLGIVAGKVGGAGANTAAVEAVIKQTVADSYREQQMGIATLLAENQRASLQQLQSHEAYMTEIVKEQSASIIRSVGAGGGGGQEAASESAEAAAEEGVPSADEQISAAIAQGNYKDAFSKALGAQDLDVVMRLCKKVDATYLFSDESEPLTEPVILSLIAQLTTDLKDDTDFKIAYLQEATMKINSQDPQTREFIPMVLNPLHEALVEVVKLPTLAMATKTSITMLTREVKRLLNPGF